MHWKQVVSVKLPCYLSEWFNCRLESVYGQLSRL